MAEKLKRVRRTGIKSTGRPKIPESERINYKKMTLQLPAELHTDLYATAKEKRRTVTSIIVELLETYLHKGDK